jgi:hypothetical protein
MSIGQQGDLLYAPSPRNGDEEKYRMSTSQQYPLTGQAHNDPRHQSPGIYSNPPTQFHQNGSSVYRIQELRPGSQPHTGDTYHGPIPDQQGYDPNYDQRLIQMQENIRTQSPSQSVPQSPRIRTSENDRTQSPRIQNGDKQTHDSEDQRVGTPERKSAQAFTVDLDTGELKEVSSNSDSMSPRSPGSTIKRSGTFKKGPEERVFDCNSKSLLPGQRNEEKVSPQASDKEPAVVHRKGNNRNSMNPAYRTSWSESAEALMSVLHNGFPNENNENKVNININYINTIPLPDCTIKIKSFSNEMTPK